MQKAINRGDIYHRFFTTTIPPKDKFFVIIGEDEKNYVGYFFINSNIPRCVVQNEEKYSMQFPIKTSDYSFLTHQSFIACYKLLKLCKTDLIEELHSGKTKFKGRILQEHMEMLLEAAIKSPVFSSKEKELFK